MIVDMIRNDLGRIAKVGSVHVPELFTVEKYPTLWQMTSTVTAKTDASITDIFTALFPCASITGAPKVSTMKIISEIRNNPAQNLYREHRLYCTKSKSEIQCRHPHRVDRP